MKLTSGSKTETGISLVVADKTYKVDEDAFIGSNYTTNSKSYIVQPQNEFNVFKQEGILPHLVPKYRLKVEPVSKYNRREIALMTVEHPNVIKLIATEKFILQQPYMVNVYPYYSDSLQSHMLKFSRDTTFLCDAKIARKVCKDIIHGLQYLHTKKIAHRGITERNVYIKQSNDSEEWMSSEEFNVILGENCALKCEREYWISKVCEPDSAIALSTDEAERITIFGIETIRRIQSKSSNTLSFDDWIRYDLIKMIELIVKVYKACGFIEGNSDAGVIIRDLNNKSFDINIKLYDIENHVIFQTREESQSIVYKVSKCIGENNFIFRKKVDPQKLTVIDEIGKDLLGTHTSWFSFFEQHLDNIIDNFQNKEIFNSGQYHSFLQFAHILIKHYNSMHLKNIGIKTEQHVLDFLMFNMSTCRLQCTRLNSKLKEFNLI